jgi:hypothetical protein
MLIRKTIFLRILLYIFLTLSAFGLILSLMVHIASLFGVNIASVTMELHGGIFIVWIPTIIIAAFIAKDAPREDFLQAAFRGCPKWMQYMNNIFFAYATINFILVGHLPCSWTFL